MKLRLHAPEVSKRWEAVFFMWMLPTIIFHYLSSDIIQADDWVMGSDTTRVSIIFNLHVIFLFLQSALDHLQLFCKLMLWWQAWA